jgi:hypothetical protein
MHIRSEKIKFEKILPKNFLKTDMSLKLKEYNKSQAERKKTDLKSNNNQPKI